MTHLSNKTFKQGKCNYTATFGEAILFLYDRATIIYIITTVSLNRIVYHHSPCRLPYSLKQCITIQNNHSMYQYTKKNGTVNVDICGLSCISVTRISTRLYRLIEKRLIYLYFKHSDFPILQVLYETTKSITTVYYISRTCISFKILLILKKMAKSVNQNDTKSPTLNSMSNI